MAESMAESKAVSMAASMAESTVERWDVLMVDKKVVSMAARRVE